MFNENIEDIEKFGNYGMEASEEKGRGLGEGRK